MKKEVIKELKDKSQLDLFTNERYELVKKTMMYGMKKDLSLRVYLSLDVQNKIEWIAQQLTTLPKQK